MSLGLHHDEILKSTVTNSLNAHTGWRRGILYCKITALLVLLCALAFIGWADGFPMESGGIRTIFMGSCKTSKNISTAVHVVINALSTLLLGAGD